MEIEQVGLKVPSIAQCAYDALISQIIGGAIRPGDRLTISDLAAQLHISDTPVKQALVRLSEQAVVRIEPRRGVYVTVPTAQSVVERLEMRALLETHAIRVGFVRESITDEFLARLRAVQTDWETKIRNQASKLELLTAEQGFHTTIMSLTDNVYLADMYERLSVHLHLAHHSVIKCPVTDFESVRKEHWRIIEALERLDCDQAVQAVLAHIAMVARRRSESATEDVEKRDEWIKVVRSMSKALGLDDSEFVK